MATDYLDLIVDSYQGAARGLWKTILTPFSGGKLNILYFLILISLLIWALEIFIPWRKGQNKIRKDFWLDTFYMFFNFFLYRVVFFAAFVKIVYTIFSSGLDLFGYQGGHLIDVSNLHWFLQLVIFFFVADFVQWGVHVVLHRVPFFWKFHKVHHSVKEMGFAAHLRYHFLETFAYEPVKYVSLALIFGFSMENIFYIYYLTILIGHLNHANLGWDYGPLKYIFNNPKMHIWHHAKELPESHPHGMNFGISLSIWDYIFRTNYVPSNGQDIELGFPNDEQYPKGFLGQLIAPFKKSK
ncbi:MAG: sterol desaturase family protein [Crocinitomicaceae bacterium]|nr:sterol desaturase family protein [Crocinitomicaceae bacterium]